MGSQRIESKEQSKYAKSLEGKKKKGGLKGIFPPSTMAQVPT